MTRSWSTRTVGSPTSSASRSRIPDGALVIDAEGRTVVPGLIDCHVHLWGSHEMLHDVVRRSYSEVVARMLRCGQAFLESGVTTARDAGGTPAGVKRVFASGEFPGPRLQVSVMPLSITGRPRRRPDACGHRPHGRRASGRDAARDRRRRRRGAARRPAPDPRGRRLDQGDGDGRRVLADGRARRRPVHASRRCA